MSNKLVSLSDCDELDFFSIVLFIQKKNINFFHFLSEHVKNENSIYFHCKNNYEFCNYFFHKSRVIF